MLRCILFVVLLVTSSVPIYNVKTTGYCPGPPCVHPKWADGKTAAGTPARHGVCAADWNVFPKGQVFDVPGYGRCRVEDTGNKVRGMHLDLYFDDINDARNWGVKTLTVYWVANETF